jgi:hypothetical protein
MQAIVRLSTNSTASLKPCVFMKDQSVSPLYCGCAGAIFQAATRQRRNRRAERR